MDNIYYRIEIEDRNGKVHMWRNCQQVCSMDSTRSVMFKSEGKDYTVRWRKTDLVTIAQQ